MKQLQKKKTSTKAENLRKINKKKRDEKLPSESMLQQEESAAMLDRSRAEATAL